jgi:hypothetical protein
MWQLLQAEIEIRVHPDDIVTSRQPSDKTHPAGLESPHHRIGPVAFLGIRMIQRVMQPA